MSRKAEGSIVKRLVGVVAVAFLLLTASNAVWPPGGTKPANGPSAVAPAATRRP
jgi:hypothetical protein